MIIKKSPEEIDRMAAAGAVLVRTLRMLEGKVREGVTTADLDRAAEKYIRSQGATPAFKGYRGFPGSICTSPNSVIVHGIPGDYALRRAVVLVPGREDPRAVGRDGHRELEVGGQRAVLRVDRPAVVAHPDHVAARVHHRLDREHHPLLELRARVDRPEVRDLRILVHVAPDPVADERAHDAQALALDAGLDRVRHVAEAVARPALLDGVEQRGLGGVE